MKIGKNKSAVAAGADLEPVWHATCDPESHQGHQELQWAKKEKQEQQVCISIFAARWTQFPIGTPRTGSVVCSCRK